LSPSHQFAAERRFRAIYDRRRPGHTRAQNVQIGADQPEIIN